MKIIHHRRNTIEELKATPEKYGIELDLRSVAKDIIVHHDPFVSGVLFKEWLTGYKHGTLILNVKEDGLESSLIEIMQSHNIQDYFFLDQSFPSLVKWAFAGEKRCAVRVSEFEPIETALAFAGKLNWVWIDCFTYFPIDRQGAQRLKEAGLKLYLVSPELQGRNPEREIQSMAEMLEERGIQADAVCTKNPDIWEKFTGGLSSGDEGR